MPQILIHHSLSEISSLFFPSSKERAAFNVQSTSLPELVKCYQAESLDGYGVHLLFFFFQQGVTVLHCLFFDVWCILYILPRVRVVYLLEYVLYPLFLYDILQYDRKLLGPFYFFTFVLRGLQMWAHPILCFVLHLYCETKNFTKHYFFSGHLLPALVFNAVAKFVIFYLTIEVYPQSWKVFHFNKLLLSLLQW